MWINPPQLSCWRNFLAAELAKLYSVPVKIDNDAMQQQWRRRWARGVAIAMFSTLALALGLALYAMDASTTDARESGGEGGAALAGDPAANAVSQVRCEILASGTAIAERAQRLRAKDTRSSSGFGPREYSNGVASEIIRRRKCCCQKFFRKLIVPCG